MIKQSDIIADLHMHTIASQHAYSSLSEMINVSKQAGYKYIAITDHLFQNQDPLLQKNETARIEYLSSRMIFEKNIKVIGGVELNLNQTPIDIEKFKKAKCWRPVGLHSWFVDFDTITLDDLYELFLEKTENNICTAFAHLEREWYRINPKYENLTPETKKMFEKIVKLAKEKNIYLEVNETSFLFNEHNPTEQLYYWLGIAKEMNCPIYLGSDAHFYNEIGHFDNCLKALNYFNYPKDLILNLDENKLETITPDVLKNI